MKIEKKLIALSILAVTIGIATVIPMTYFLNAKAQTNIADSLFNIDIPCAYYNANATYNVVIHDIIHGGSDRVYDTWFRDNAVIAVQPSINYTVLDKNTVSRIELFEYTLYTDKLQIQKTHSYLSFNEEAFEHYNDKDSLTTEYWQETLLDKSDGRTGYSFGGLSVSDPGEQIPVWIAGENENHGYNQSDNSYKKGDKILETIKDTQTIYLDIRRVAYISLSADGTVIIVEDNKLLHHLELTKNDNGYMFGTPADIRVEIYSGRQREYYFGLPNIPYSGTDVPEELWSTVWPDRFGK
ncbi:MAG: hypothetical protein FWB84_04245 [Candidatus Bathyarchaeota archaeon]|uniref:hypothetical protein n=1 Tax=Candidatus Bathycorpusculum sp. TaxID=2994959 RepID=UPI00281D5E11|nr:hypothetical protein [Candidatus Termiticorpusculum sp.]MCL2257382.1 hypothetical protein [Candidatus Termiticorpusculum sp.]MCL2292519.1 hypothetical protein [Candidatus Termiticorpusculum sp.]